jgi:hypothetical protein
MHRIDGPGATVDGLFTEGNPAAGVPATVVTAAWMNDIQEELLTVLSAGGVAPVKGVQDQLLRAIRTMSTGAVGTATNLKMTVPTASASATITADQVVVGAGLGGQAYRLSSYIKSINLATTGPGGMDAGTAPANGYVALYAIYNPATGASSILATNATSAVMPAVYSAAPYPAGYTASALLAVVPTGASAIFKVFRVQGRKVSFPLVTCFTSTVNTPITPVGISSAVPPNAIEIWGEMSIGSSVNAALTLTIISDSTNIGQQNVSGILAAGAAITGNFSNTPIMINQTISVIANTTAGVPTFVIYIGGYLI